MKFYNTLTRKKEDFSTVDGSNTVRMYSCGPTVYNYAHIGNMRTYIFMDTLVKALKYEGFKVKSVMNITDVGHLQSDADDGEDKMEKAAKAQQKSPYEIAAHYTKVFFEDFKKLNIDRPTVVPKATEHINDMIDIVKTLLDKGYGYEIDDGIYFDIGKLGVKYGQLSNIDLEEQIAGARVEVNSGKRHPADFAIWKKAEPTHIMQWENESVFFFTQKFERVYLYNARGKFELLSRASKVVRSFSADVLCRILRRILLDFSGKLRQNFFHVFFRNDFVAPCGYFAVVIERVCGIGKIEHGYIRLFLLQKYVEKPCRFAERYRQHAGRQRIERSEMPDFFYSRSFPYYPYGVRRRHADGF